jgi:1-acyl-sn-glycerol-3-phosphate acyltransferase
MLYHFLKFLFTPAVRAYFKSYKIANAQAIPDKGPVIFSLNHNSAFMDPILFTVSTKRVLHYLARGEAFNSTFSRAFYKKINMLPIYRPETTPGEVHKNKFAFLRCHEHLKKGKAIIIFPEGFSKTERRLRPIKSGLARIAFGAEEDNNFELNLKIIPIGLNYSNPHLFRSDVFINVGEPILVKDYQKLYEKDFKLAYDELTNRVRMAMEECTIVISDERQDNFVEHLDYLYRNTPEKGTKSSLEAHFKSSKDFVHRVNELGKSDPEKFKSLELRLNNYIKRLSRLNIKDKHLFSEQRSSSMILRMLYLIIFFPLFIYGLVGNIVPLKLTSLLSRKIAVREDFVGSLKLAAGMFIFLIFHILESLAVANYTNWYIGLMFLFSLYPTGLFSLHYSKWFLAIVEDFKLLSITKRKSTFIESLKKERLEILRDLQIGSG